MPKFSVSFFLSFFLCMISTASFAQTTAQDNDLMPSFFDEATAAVGRDVSSSAPVEVVDPFTGSLNLVHQDIVVPGNGGMDLVINRIYSSKNVYEYGLQDLSFPRSLGRGWEMHMGRVLLPPNLPLCVELEIADANHNPIMETSSGAQIQFHQNRNSVSNADYMSLDNWVMYCDTSEKVTVIDPQGNTYRMDQKVSIFSSVTGVSTTALYPSRITDRNDNYFDIDYESFGVAGSVRSGVLLDRISASDGRSVSFSHTARSDGRKYIRSASSGGRTWTYNYNSSHNLSSVNRPIGTWKYTYNSSGYKLLKSIEYPWGAKSNFTYEADCLSIVSCVFSRYPGQGRDAYSLVLKRKTSSGPSIDAGVWTYAYTRSSGQDTTTVNFEEGKTIYRHHSAASQGLWRIGKLKSKRIYEGSTLVKEESYEYEKGFKINNRKQERRPYIGGLNQSEFGVYSARVTKKTVKLDGTSYTTTYSNFDASDNPRTMVESGQGSKTTTLSYYPRRNGQNITGLVEDESFGSSSADKILRDYDADANLESETRFGVKTRYSHDSQGNISRLTDANGKSTSFSSYYRGVARTESQPESTTISRGVNSFGAITSVRDGRGNTTSFSLDALDRVKGVNYPTGTRMSISWSSNSATITRGGFRSSLTLDGFGREVCNNYEGISQSKSYNSIGVLVFSSLPTSSCSSTVGNTYSPVLGRLTRTRYEDASTRSYRYSSGNRVNMTDELSRSFQFTYRSYGNPDVKTSTKITGPEGLSVTIGRNKLGQPTSINRNGTTRMYSYTKSFLTSMVDPETGTTTFGRDGVGNMKTKKTGGVTQTLTYDGRNRVKSISYGSGTPNVAYTYDKNDNIKTLNSGISSLRYSYDANNNLLEEKQIIAGATYTVRYTMTGSII